MHSKPFMTQRALQPPHGSVQMEAFFLQIKRLSRIGGQNSVLNRPSNINEDAIVKLPQIECNVLLDKCPTVNETRKEAQQLTSGKAPGADAIPAEVYKAGGLPIAEKLTELFHCLWRKEAIPLEFKDASIIHLYKRKDRGTIDMIFTARQLKENAKNRIYFYTRRLSTSPKLLTQLVVMDS